MRRTLSDLELRLFAETLIWKKKYDDSNPDVGMGYFIDSMVIDIASSVLITLEHQQVLKIIELAKMRDPYTMGKG